MKRRDGTWWRDPGELLRIKLGLDLGVGKDLREESIGAILGEGTCGHPCRMLGILGRGCRVQGTLTN